MAQHAPHAAAVTGGGSRPAGTDRLDRLLQLIDLERESAWAAIDRLVDEVGAMRDDDWVVSRARLEECRRAELGYD